MSEIRQGPADGLDYADWNADGAPVALLRQFVPVAHLNDMDALFESVNQPGGSETPITIGPGYGPNPNAITHRAVASPVAHGIERIFIVIAEHGDTMNNRELADLIRNPTQDQIEEEPLEEEKVRMKAAKSDKGFVGAELKRQKPDVALVQSIKNSIFYVTTNKAENPSNPDEGPKLVATNSATALGNIDKLWTTQDCIDDSGLVAHEPREGGGGQGGGRPTDRNRAPRDRGQRRPT